MAGKKLTKDFVICFSTPTIIRDAPDYSGKIVGKEKRGVRLQHTGLTIDDPGKPQWYGVEYKSYEDPMWVCATQSILID